MVYSIHGTLNSLKHHMVFLNLLFFLICDLAIGIKQESDFTLFSLEFSHLILYHNFFLLIQISQMLNSFWPMTFWLTGNFGLVFRINQNNVTFKEFS